jgi:hypothetical protein
MNLDCIVAVSPPHLGADKLIWNETYWADRAKEARAIQQEIRNCECKRIMGEIADPCDRLAVPTSKFQNNSHDDRPYWRQGGQHVLIGRPPQSR